MWHKNFLLLLMLYMPVALSNEAGTVNSNAPVTAKDNTSNTTPVVSARATNNSVPAVVINTQFDQYFQLKKIDPENAMLLLQQILIEEPNNATAQAEIGYLLLAKHDLPQALQHFMVVYRLKPNDELIKKQIDYINQELSANKKTKIVPGDKKAGAVGVSANRPLSATDALLNQYYQAKKTNLKLAKILLERLLIKDPENVTAQKEMGYLLLNEKNYRLALCHFQMVDRLTQNNYEIKMQIGYLLDNLARKREAYAYFAAASVSPDCKLSLTANQAMTNLAGTQTKILCKPWFADMYFSPLYYSRFRLLVYPIQVRFGRTFGQHEEWEAYASTRATTDNRSKGGAAGANVGQLPQVFDDEVAIFALGVRYKPFYKSFPNFALYTELGKAYDLIDQHPLQSRWRNDARGGFFFDTRWGAKDEYAETLIFPFKQVGTAYGDLSYYSRYSNLIGYLNLTEGLRAAEYHASNLDLYVSVRSAFDKNQEFYNNFVEIGPAIRLTPNNRYGFRLSAEFLQGYYFNVNSPTPNPYGAHYYNMLGIAEFYIKI